MTKRLKQNFIVGDRGVNDCHRRVSVASDEGITRQPATLGALGSSQRTGAAASCRAIGEGGAQGRRWERVQARCSGRLATPVDRLDALIEALCERDLAAALFRPAHLPLSGGPKTGPITRYTKSGQMTSQPKPSMNGRTPMPEFSA